jgi:hypothetical protein
MPHAPARPLRTVHLADITTERPGRRAAMRLVGAMGLSFVSASAALVRAQGEATPLCSDNDPTDPAGAGRHCPGCSDSDAHDPAGLGRFCGRGIYRCSDSDPTDPAGEGHHC